MHSLGGARIDLEPQNQHSWKHFVLGRIPGFHVADFSELLFPTIRTEQPHLTEPPPAGYLRRHAVFVPRFGSEVPSTARIVTASCRAELPEILFGS